MPRFLIDHELPRATQRFEETLGIGNRAQLVSLAGATEIWDVDLVGVSHPRECLSKLIKGRFIGYVRHEHEPHFECWRSLLKDRMESRLETCRADSDRPIARLVRHRDGSAERTVAAARRCITHRNDPLPRFL